MLRATHDLDLHRNDFGVAGEIDFADGRQFCFHVAGMLSLKTKAILALACPFAITAVAHWKWGSHLRDTAAFALGTLLSSLFWLVFGPKAPNRRKAQILNDNAIRILRTGTVVKRDARGPRDIGPRPPQLDKATRLLQKAQKADPTWAACSFNLACCLFYLNIVDSAQLLMELVIEEASEDPNNLESQHILKFGPELVKHVREVADSWFAALEVVPPELFIMSSSGGQASSKSNGLPMFQHPAPDTGSIASRLASIAAADAGDKHWREEYDKAFLKSDETLSDENRRCFNISKELHLALSHISRRRLDDGERLLRKTATDAENVQHPQTRCIAFMTLGDFLYQMQNDLQMSESWLRRAAKEAERMASEPGHDDPRLRRKVFKHLAEVLDRQGRTEEARDCRARARNA